MESTDKKHFDRIIWVGLKPSNKAREQLLSQLLVFLGYEAALEARLSQDAARQLVLGNLEDFDSTWPKPDGKGVYLGLFCATFPDSKKLLSDFDEHHVSFYLNEKTQLIEVEEYLEDLLKS